MRIDITSMFFNSKIEGQTATPAWGSSIGQNKSRDCRIDDFKPEVVEMVIGMTYKSISDLEKLDVSKGSSNRDILMCSVFDSVYVNNRKLEGAQYTLLLVREHSKSHEGRLLVSYAPYINYNEKSNQDCIDQMREALGCTTDGCWFVYDIAIKDQSDLHFKAVVVNANSPMIYSNNVKSRDRSEEWKLLIPSGKDSESDSDSIKSLQLIYYGAPGTGKSHTIKDKISIAEKDERVFRTTFHPDSDYSTFVGCYKPSMKQIDRLFTAEELAVKLKEIKNSGVTYPCHKFAAQYWRSLKDLSGDVVKQILIACGFTESMNVEISKGIAIGQEYLNRAEDGKIIYTFIPQAFTNAYVKAWNTTEDVYLIIEEINRGNCAQIFGDLFQLLDREEGFSKYSIDSDTDLSNYLCDKLANSCRYDFPDGVKNGKKLVLPNNLYIWATMNTSDQSLYPIDSAFKRRWDWKYIPIKNHEDKDFRIEIGETTYSWWGFLEKINSVIGAITSSEDKKLGYFFAGSNNPVINADIFVGKVLFYLWNDVFKNYAFDSPIFNKDENAKFAFSEFFTNEGNAEVKMINKFMNNLDKTIDSEHTFVYSIDDDPSKLLITYNGTPIGGNSARDKYFETIKLVVLEKGGDAVCQCLGADLTQTPAPDNTRRFVEIDGTGWYLATNVGIDVMKTKLGKIKQIEPQISVE